MSKIIWKIRNKLSRLFYKLYIILEPKIKYERPKWLGEKFKGINKEKYDWWE